MAHGPATPKKDRRATYIVIALVVAAIMIAVGGTTAMIFLRGTAPNEAFEVIVTPTMPLAIGDQVTYVEGSHSCSGVSVLGVEPDGRVTVMACQGVSHPVAVSRAMLRVGRFPRQNGTTTPQTGDIVLVQEAGRHVRAEVITAEPQHRIRVRPLRGAPDALDVAVTERIVDQDAALLMARPSLAPGPLYIPVGDAPLEPGDTVRELVRSSGESTQYDAVVVEASSARPEVLLQRMVGDTPNGAPLSAPRSRLLMRVLRPFDAATSTEIVLEPTAGGPRRAVVVRDEGVELCVREMALDAASPCHALPKSAIFVLRGATR